MIKILCKFSSDQNVLDGSKHPKRVCFFILMSTGLRIHGTAVFLSVILESNCSEKKNMFFVCHLDTDCVSFPLSFQIHVSKYPSIQIQFTQKYDR